MELSRFYKKNALHEGNINRIKSRIIKALNELDIIEDFKTEGCYYVESSTTLNDVQKEKFLWIIQEPFKNNEITSESILKSKDFSKSQLSIEIGPRLNFCTPFSTNVVSICQQIGLKEISRVETSVIYLIKTKRILEKGEKLKVTQALYDKMTECVYEETLKSFQVPVNPNEVFEVDILGEGRSALKKVSNDLGLAFDDWDLDYYTKLFSDKIRRNPTNVECFDLAQSNSEHSRHWFFKGRMVVDGEEEKNSLFQMVMNTQEYSNPNNVIKFSDNSSAIHGSQVDILRPSQPESASPFEYFKSVKRHALLTAETHNFPTGVAPFPGATTGTGGRIRDVQATGRGANVVAGSAGYSFGNLLLDDLDLPWEDKSAIYPPNFAKPLDIIIEGSNGASDYGNKFGEPVITGFARNFGGIVGGKRVEWIKPIMFSGGVGSLDDSDIHKLDPEKGMKICKVGGPVYRIGVGGGAASSVKIQGDNEVELDFGAVQRGDAEMEQKLNRVIRACIESKENPICSIHDQGAGGNGNVLKEISEPLGADIMISKFRLADPTLSVLEIWGAEYQESNAILIKDKSTEKLKAISKRERCSVDFVGEITGSSRIRLVDDRLRKSGKVENVVDLDLESVLGKMPRKIFNMESPTENKEPPFKLPVGTNVMEALERVLTLPSVGSKRYLTNKVDRSVTGLVAQQQCVGPLHTPVADVGVVALSYFSKYGTATSIGEQPIKTLVDAEKGARMAVGESLTNLVWAFISDLRDVKCSANWMWPAKIEGEGSKLVKACKAMCECMKQLGIAVDGGKDSLSMAARVQNDTVISPGTLVISNYVSCSDITLTVTPDLKCSNGVIFYVPLSPGKSRLGGSALAQVFGQIGCNSPDLEDCNYFKKVFNITSNDIADKFLTSGHDVSDGGLITCLLEMAFAGNCGLEVNIKNKNNDAIDYLFAEELGLVFEANEKDIPLINQLFSNSGIICEEVARTKIINEVENSKISICFNGDEIISESMVRLRDIWERTSFALEKRQTNRVCVEEEESNLSTRKNPTYVYRFDCDDLVNKIRLLNHNRKFKVAIIREEGSNGDREMAAAFYSAGFEVWDVNSQDICDGFSLDGFNGVAFVGGFSYADVCGSAKGWAATIRYNDKAKKRLDRFYSRPDTFSLGVCNGCQLMALLGWIDGVFIDHNVSERYESRWVSVRIRESNSILLKDMEDSILGVYVSHGEGRFTYNDSSALSNIKRNKQLCMQYVDAKCEPTMEYPLNPNGSREAVAGLSSENGRHLAVMPHPERCFLSWQWPYKPSPIAN
ncbi:DgyrCDS2951 [Dimorphilus gyrociliatus]|uniref:Phosphoribosylformylglycinamidine synthase n=1 Tax=Dimorphilus gyrociliatus TaxID=2664684 RepID=A0A7I8VCZ6_9ANNE|nr:DgyrCDS2951 [Dimorphilus gyrociliatus]